MRLLRKYYFFPLLLFLSLFIDGQFSFIFSRFIPNQFEAISFLFFYGFMMLSLYFSEISCIWLGIFFGFCFDVYFLNTLGISFLLFPLWYEILADNTVEELKHIHAVYDLAKEQGDITDSSYEALEKRWKDENAERSEKVEKGEVIYGLKEYTFQLYLDYEISTLKEKYCNDTNREGMKLTEDEIQEHYQSREWIFGDSDENADLEMARIAVERELREQKYDDMITQRETDSQVAGNMENVNRLTLKNIQ